MNVPEIAPETFKKIDGANDAGRKPRKSRKDATHQPLSNYEQIVTKSADGYLDAFIAYVNRSEAPAEKQAREAYEAKPSHSYTIAGHSVKVYDSGKKVILNAETTGYFLELHEMYDSKCALHAVEKLYTNEVVRHFEKVEVGFQSFAKSMSHPKSDWAARVSYRYNGTNKNLLACKPDSGVNILRHTAGYFSIQREIPRCPYADKSQGQVFNDVMGDIIQFKESLYMDSFLLGERIEITPFLYKNAKDEDGNFILKDNGKKLQQYAPGRVIGFVNARVDGFGKPVEEAARNTGARIAAAIMVGETQKEAEYVKDIVAHLPEEHKNDINAAKLTVDGTTYLLEELFGQFVGIYHGNFVIKERQFVSEGSRAFVLAAASNPKYTLKLLK